MKKIIFQKYLSYKKLLAKKNKKIDYLKDKNNERYNLNEENKNLRKRLKIEGQYAKYWLGGKFKEYTPFLNWPKDEDL